MNAFGFNTYNALLVIFKDEVKHMEACMCAAIESAVNSVLVCSVLSTQ